MGILLQIQLKMKVLCGLVASALAAPAPVIIGGKDASDGEFPHQVSLKRATGSHYCGGSVIGPNMVMCAAHCKQSSLSFTAGAGSATLMEQRQSFGAAAQIPHPDYNSRLIDWDYMVIRINGEWDFTTEYVQPIKIVDPIEGELPNDTPCETSGYGYSQYVLGQPGVIAPTLQWTPLRCITTAECKRPGCSRPSLLASSALSRTTPPLAWVTPADL